MSTLPVRYTNNHHVASTKTASPIVVAVNKAAVAGCAQSAYHRHHQQKQFLQHQRYHHATPPVKRHPTKMAAARRAKSRSRSRAAAAQGGSTAALSSGGSPEKRRNAGNKKKKALPQLMLTEGAVASSSSSGEQQASLTAQNMVLDVATTTLNGGAAAAAAGGSSTKNSDGVQATTMDTLGGGLEAEWRTSVGGDVLRTPDAAACDRVAEQLNQQEEIVTDNEKVIADHNSNNDNDHLMDTSEAMDDEVASSSSQAATVSVATMTGGDSAEAAAMAPRRCNEELFAELQEALALEPKYQPMLYLPQSSQDGEITIGARDGAAHVLRCLKVWYELPTDVLFAAINLVDRFLAKMKVRPKHLACISVGSLYLAAEQLLGSKMNTEDLALISQCRCTAGDLERMAGIIANKLGVQPGTAPATALTFIRLFYHLFRNAAYELGLDEFYEKSISLAELEQRLEVLACDANCSSIRASELALVLICTQMDSHASGVVNQQISGLVDYAIEVQKLARIPDQTFFQSHAAVVSILARYNSSQHKMPYKQRLVWKLSSRTMRVLRPSNKMTSYLPTIDEHNQSSFDSLSRFRTGSLSSEDDEDWPTSPVVPIYEEVG